MKIIISPTKKMKTEEYISPLSMPLFLEKTKEILSYLVSLTDEEKAVSGRAHRFDRSGTD